MISFSLIAMPMTCLLLNEFVGGAVIDAAIPAIYSALLVFGAILFSISFVALIICVIVILVSTNYWAFVYRPASLAHSRRKRKLKIIAANGGRTRASIKFNATSSNANSSSKMSRYQPDSITAYCRRVFHIVKRSLQYGITALSYRRKREKKHVAAQSVWCGMNRPLLIFRTSEDPRNKSYATPSSPTSPLSASKSFSTPFLSSSPPKTPFSPTPSFSAFYPASSFSAFSPSPSRSFRNLYSRQVKSPGLSAVPVCVRKMLIISTDTAVQEREKEKDRRQKQRDRENGGVGRSGDTLGGGGRGGRGERGGRGGRGEELGSRVRGRGGVQFSRQFSSTRSLGDELIVTRTGLADSSRRLVAPSIMFHSRQVLTLMRSRLSMQKSNIPQVKGTHRRIFPMNSNEDSFPEADFILEFRYILDVFYPDGMTLTDEAKEESCELFDIWKNEYFAWSDATTGGGTTSTNIQSEVRMINFKTFEDWFSNEFVFLIHSNLSDRIMDNITRSPVLAVTVKNKVKVKEVDEEALHCTTNAVSWFAPPPARARRRLGDLIREEEKEENRI